MPITINSRSCSNAGFWTKHLQKTETNERVEIIGFYGLSAETIKDAFGEMRAMAQASKNCTNYFSQYNINPRADEHLTEAQWEEAHALHRKNHGLDHLPYFRVRHIKDGRVHEHGIALRVDPDTGKAISDSLTAPINERTSRELEIRFGLERGHSVLTPDREQQRPDRRPKKHENFRAERSGIDPEMVKADARAVLQRADNGQSFRAALEESGSYVLARGDRRDFVIIDGCGDDHSLARRLGMKTAELRAYMADLDPASLPSVAEAKAQQQARRAEREAAQVPQAAAAPSNTDTHDDSRKRRKMATGDDMDDDIATKQREQRQAAEDRQAAIYNDMVAERNRAERFIQDWQRDHEKGERNKRHLQEAQWRREAESDITDVNARALLAAGESRDFVQAVRREGAMITQEHADIERQAALETDPDKKQLLYLKRDIQQADYMALANERIAAMSNLNGEQYKDALRQQEVWAKIGTDLRKERLELQERMADQEMDRINEAVERMNTADQQRAGFRADIRGIIPPAAPETPREAAQAQEAAATSPAPGSPATRASEAERPAEIIYLGPAVPERQKPTRENTDARQRQTQELEAASTRENTDARQSNSTENAEITDTKAAKKAALALHRAETEQSIAQGQERSFGHSR